MRGLIGALLFGQALAVRPRHDDGARVKDSRSVVNINGGLVKAVAHITIPVPSESHDDWEREVLGIKLEVSDSAAACGFGNLTLDGQALPQTLVNGISSGKGSVTADRKSTIIGSWNFLCVNVNGIPDSQLMKFVIDFVDGNAVKNVGFSVLFRQYGSVEIIKIETDLSIPDEILANPNPVALRPLHNPVDIPEYNIEEELAELDYLWAQMYELKYLIHEKERAITHHSHKHPDSIEEELEKCDSLKCIAKAIAKEAKKVAFRLYGKVSGNNEEFGPRGKQHFRRPHFPKHHFHCPKNSTHPPHHPEGNHTHEPHKRPLPICRYPPPPHHRKSPHHDKPLEHMPPTEFDESHNGMHPSEESPNFDRPLQKHYGMKPHEKSPEDDLDFNTSPDFDRPEHQQGKGFHDGPPDFDSPPPHGHPHDKPPYHSGPPHGGPGPHHEHSGPEDQEHMRPEGDFHPRPMFDGPGPQDHGPGTLHGPPPPPGARTLTVVKYTAISFLCAFLLLALHRRACNSKRRADRQARREARHARRAYRRAAYKHIISRILARISGHGLDDEYGDYEEKREALLVSAEDGMSTTMTEEIGQLRNAADVVSEIVEAGAGRASSPTPSQSISLRPTQPGSSPPEDRPLLRAFEISMLNVGGEELPAYEHNDGSEDSSVVADGFRYTPGSSNYSPSHSPSGSVSDISGHDTKS